MQLRERAGELVIAGVFFSIGLLWILVSRDMPYGEFAVPGPGFFPSLLGVLLCGVSGALGVQVLFRRNPARIEVGHRHIWAMAAALLVLAFFFETLGFILSISLFLGFLLKSLSSLKWPYAVFWAVAGALVARLFFQSLLGIQLP